MSELFLRIINMSISASYIVLAVLLLRLILKKAPKWIAVILWGIVAVRLVCPFSVESILSLMPSAETVSPDIMMDTTPEINTGIPIINQVINPVISGSFTPDPGTSANPLQLWIPTFAAIWIIGVFALLVYTVISYARVRRKIGTAVLLRDNIYQSENVVSPFVLGIIKPKIYLPFNMREKDMEHVLAHETAHIRRKDHLWKPIGFLLLTIHWFNPLMWLGYVFLCRDIELACDEKVIMALDHDARADYSEALLTCSVNRRMIAACPIAFGEVGVKNRVKTVLNYKKPAFWIVIAAIIACVVVAVCFLTNPKDSNYGETDESKLTSSQIALMERFPEYFGLDASKGLDVYVWQFAENSYSFGVLPHVEEKRDWLSDELLGLKSVTLGQMRTILETYKIDEMDIYVIPWNNPLSSYIGDWQIYTVGENHEERIASYVEKIRKMLFDTPQDNSNNLWVCPLPSDGDGVEAYVSVRSVGCGLKDVLVDFKGVRLKNEHIIFDVQWTNKGNDIKDIGPDFEMYKYNGSSLEKLEHKGVWLYYREILPGKDMRVEGDTDGVTLVDSVTASYDITEHYDITSPGKYRLEVHGVWVEFIVIGYSGTVVSVALDSAVFDIDGDGTVEICNMLPGPTSGIFSFIFLVRDIETGETKYNTVFTSEVYDLSFVNGDDGVMRVEAVTQKGERHIFDIDIKNGLVDLTENGIPIARIVFNDTGNVKLVYDAPVYSYVMSPDEVPEIVIEGNVIYTVELDQRTRLGTVTEVSLSKDNFDAYIDKYAGFDYSKLASNLRANNKIAYEVTPDSDECAIGIYYVMEQKSGEILIVYGHSNVIRFIFSVVP